MSKPAPPAAGFDTPLRGYSTSTPLRGSSTSTQRRLGGVKRAALLLATGVVLLAGCSMAPTTRSGYEYPFSVDIIEESRTSASAPAEFRDRDPLPQCEDVSLEQGTQIPDASVACVEQAGPDQPVREVVGTRCRRRLYVIRTARMITVA